MTKLDKIFNKMSFSWGDVRRFIISTENVTEIKDSLNNLKSVEFNNKVPFVILDISEDNRISYSYFPNKRRVNVDLGTLNKPKEDVLKFFSIEGNCVVFNSASDKLIKTDNETVKSIMSDLISRSISLYRSDRSS